MEHQQTTALATTEPHALARLDELSVEEIVARVDKVKEVQGKVMKEGKHYGKIPGVDKPTLLKPGAEILGMVFRLDPQFEIVEQLREGDHISYVIRCVLFHAPTGARLGSGLGSCSTHESKYAYRKGERVCPDCGKATIIKGKEEYGGGWLCFAKKGGCGAKFADAAPVIVTQVTGRVENDDVADQHNTVLKMATKRAHVAAILFVTCASEIFTQDVEDMPRKEEPRQNETRGSDEVSALLVDYAQCRDGGAYQKLEARRKKVWGSRGLSKEAKQKLKAAADAAQQRVLDAMDAPQSDDDDQDDDFGDEDSAPQSEVA